MSLSLFPFAVPAALFLVFWALCSLPLAGLINAARASARGVSALLAHSRVGKWAVAHSGPLGLYAPMILVMVVGGIAAVAAAHLFVELAEQVQHATSAVSRTDQAINAWFGHARRAGMTVLLDGATTIGSVPVLGTIVAAVAAALLVRKERASAAFVMVTAGLGFLLNLGLKMIFARTRPDLASALAVARGYSFPSGHAMSSFITFGALSYLALRQPWPWVAKSAGLAFALTVVVLIGLSRVYLGVHWASDIAGGWSAGMVWLISAVVAFEMVLRIGRRTPSSDLTHPT